MKVKVALEVGSEAWARDIQRPYDPVSWQKTIGYSTKEHRCCASVHDGGRSVGFHQCGRKPKIWYGTIGYCSQHDPKATIERQDAWNKMYRDQSEKSMAAYRETDRLKALSAASICALKSIASGHNDPRSLATETLNAHSEPLDHKTHEGL